MNLLREMFLQHWTKHEVCLVRPCRPSNINLDTVLFYDAETRPIDTYENISTLPEYKDLHDLWNIRVELLKNQDRIKGVKTEKEAFHLAQKTEKVFVKLFLL